MSHSFSKRTKKLAEKVNKALKNKPLVFFSREVERATGLENLLENYHIACIEDSPIVDLLNEQNKSVFCVEKESKVEILDKSTKSLLQNEKLLSWLRSVSKNKSFYGMTLYPHQTTKHLVSKLGGEFLANDFSLTQKFENKIFSFAIFQKLGLRLPEQKILTLDNDLEKEKFPFVLQFEKGHTGNSTFFIHSQNDLETLLQEKAGSKVKISEYLEGIPLTLNCLVTEETVLIGSLQYQITGIPELTKSKGTTVGNDFSLASGLDLTDNFIEELVNQINILAKFMSGQGYMGLFGVDLIMQNDVPYLIEINARQTANIPFQTELELSQIEQPPLHLLNIAYLLGIDISNEINEYKHLHRLEGSQIFMRAFIDKTKIYNEYDTGIYRLQSDNVAKDFDKVEKYKDNVIFTDEPQDKPLIFYRPSYSLNKIREQENAGFVLLFQRQGQVKNSTEELLRMKYNSTAMTKDFQLKPWIKEIFVSLRKEIAYEEK